MQRIYFVQCNYLIFFNLVVLWSITIVVGFKLKIKKKLEFQSYLNCQKNYIIKIVIKLSSNFSASCEMSIEPICLTQPPLSQSKAYKPSPLF